MYNYVKIDLEAKFQCLNIQGIIQKTYKHIFIVKL